MSTWQNVRREHKCRNFTHTAIYFLKVKYLENLGKTVYIRTRVTYQQTKINENFFPFFKINSQCNAIV